MLVEQATALQIVTVMLLLRPNATSATGRQYVPPLPANYTRVSVNASCSVAAVSTIEADVASAHPSQFWGWSGQYTDSVASGGYGGSLFLCESILPSGDSLVQGMYSEVRVLCKANCLRELTSAL